MLKNAKAATPTFKKYDAEKAEVDDEEDDALPAARTKETKRAQEPPQQFPYRDIYFYHPDHLGTSTFLTDANGQPYQFFLNLPFGETMAEQHSLTEAYESPFKFNGKELDDETGLYYYGARYYDPRTSIWLSTDPLMEDYPGFNSYVYCFQNPINLTDPTGMEPEGNDPVDGEIKRKNVVVLPKNIRNDDIALQNIKLSAEQHLDDSVILIYAKDIADLDKQLKDKLKGAKIGTISNHQHGTYESNSFRVGDERVKNEGEGKKFGRMLSKYTDNESLIVLQSCHAGSGKDMQKSEDIMKAIGYSSRASVAAPMTWGRGSASLFTGINSAVRRIPSKYKSNWRDIRMNSSYLDTYKLFNMNTNCTRFSKVKNGKFSRNGTFTFK